MIDHHKKQISAEVPFHFLNGLGHDTRAMERFFDLPRETQETLTDAVTSADDPDARSAQASWSASAPACAGGANTAL